MELKNKNEFSVKAVIFDMDGLLIDSEPLWREAVQKVFQKLNVSLEKDRLSETMGMRVDEVVEYWFSAYSVHGVVKNKVVADIVEEVINLVKTKGNILDGVHEIIELFNSQNIPMAIASSSAMDIIDAVLEKISIKNKMTVIHSAEHEPFGKPHPGVYITTAEKLGFLPEQCIAFEDSPNGLISAKAAKMKCVAVPDQKVKDDKRFGISDLILNSLKDFTLEHLKTL
jgi:sugar-phosphatase